MKDIIKAYRRVFEAVVVLVVVLVIVVISIPFMWSSRYRKLLYTFLGEEL